MRLSVACVVSVVLGCGGKHNGDGKELASIEGVPVDVQVLPPDLVFRTSDPDEDLTSAKTLVTGPHNRLIAIPLAGGAAQVLGRMPAGEYRVGKNGIALTAKNEVAILDGGTAKKVGTLSGDGKTVVWLDDGVVVVTNGNTGECCDLVRMSTKDGSTTSIGKLKGVGRGIVAVDGGDSYLAEGSTGETIKIDRTGAISQIGTPGDGTYVCLGLTEKDLWWARAEDNHTIISAMPRGGGAASTVVEIANKGPYCATSKTELFYTDGNHIKAIATGGKPRIVVDTVGEPRTLAVNGSDLYWAEDTGKKFSIRTAPIR